MTASPLPIGTETGVSFTPHPTLIDRWVVTVDGDERTITRDGSGFIAWIGSQSRHWCFDHALRACVDDARWMAFQHADAIRIQKQFEANRKALLDALTAEQVASIRAETSLEIQLLNYSEDPNSCARQDRLRAQLEIEHVHA